MNRTSHANHVIHLLKAVYGRFQLCLGLDGASPREQRFAQQKLPLRRRLPLKCPTRVASCLGKRSELERLPCCLTRFGRREKDLLQHRISFESRIGEISGQAGLLEVHDVFAAPRGRADQDQAPADRWAVERQRLFYCTSDRVLAPNESSRHVLSNMGVPLDRIGIWSRGVEHELFNPAKRDVAWRRGHGLADDAIVLLFFGRIVREKGTGRFVEVVHELRRRGLCVKPMVVGDGPARAEMQQQLGDALFLGHLDGERLGQAVASADILLNPSVTEAFGNVNLEAMAAGLAVVSADVGSASAIITDGLNGLLVAPDVIPLADAVFELAQDPARQRRLGRKATRTAWQYRWSDVLDEVVDEYWGLARPVGR